MKLIEACLLSLWGGLSIFSGSKHPELHIYNLVVCAVIGCLLSFYFDKGWNIKDALRRSGISLIITSFLGIISWIVAPVTWLTYTGILLTPFIFNLIQSKNERTV